MRLALIVVIAMLAANCSPGDGHRGRSADRTAGGAAPTSDQLRDAMQELHNANIDVAACEASDRFDKQQLAALHSTYDAVRKELRSPDITPEVRRALAQAQPPPVMKLCPEGDVAPHLARFVKAADNLRSLLQRAR